jgi:hypothetical protein
MDVISKGGRGGLSVKLLGDDIKWADIDREAVEFRSVFQPRACYLDFQLICSMIC